MQMMKEGTHLTAEGLQQIKGMKIRESKIESNLLRK